MIDIFKNALMGKTKNKSWLPIFILLFINSVIGVIVLDDYGISLDEPVIHIYTSEVLNAYPLYLKYGVYQTYINNLQLYGPAYFSMSALFSMLLQKSLNITEIQGFHFSYFISFQIATISLYSLAQRWLNKFSSLSITLLFVSQPLFWGHSFINPKDIPFMSFFLLSVAVGFSAVDQLSVRLMPNSTNLFHLRRFIGRVWRKARKYFVKDKVFSSLAFFIYFLYLYCLYKFLENFVVLFLESGYQGKNFVASYFFIYFAPGYREVPIENFIQKALYWFDRGILVFFLTSIFIVFFLLQKKQIIQFFAKIFLDVKVTFSLRLFLAGFILGLVTGIRVLGPLSGVLVISYLIFRIREKSIIVILAYAFVALLTCYIVWPYLWSNPIHNFINSLRTMSAFPWKGRVLFFGNFYNSDALPWYYLPVLIFLQFTEPVLLLSFVGFFLFIKYIFQKDVPIDLFLVIFVWFLFPSLLLIIFKRPMYDNFRQFFFLLPPMFLLAGLTIDYLHKYFAKTITVIVSVALITSIFINVQLHPYQYIYYNSLVGGVGSAVRRFELDYWETSYKEAIEYINTNAPIGASVYCYGREELIKPYARQDLIISSNNRTIYDVSEFNYVIVTSRGNRDQGIYPNLPAIYTVERNGAPLAVVKEINPPIIK